MHENIELVDGDVDSSVDVAKKKVSKKKVAKKKASKKKAKKKVAKKQDVAAGVVSVGEGSEGEVISFVVKSGAHQGKVVRYTVGQKSLYVGKSGLLVNLSLLGVVETGKRKEAVVFRFMYGASESSAELPKREFGILKAAVNGAMSFRPGQVGHSGGVSGSRGNGPVVVSGRGRLAQAARVGSRALGALKQGARRVAGSTGCKTCGR